MPPRLLAPLALLLATWARAAPALLPQELQASLTNSSRVALLPNLEHRPDILHQSMLILLDSPLNKAGLLRLFVRSERGVLIEVNPSIRIPRTFRRFCGLMTQLLFKLSIRASDGSHKLLKASAR